MTELDRAVSFNASALHLQKPKIRFGSSKNFLTPTTLAALSTDGSSILVNRNALSSDPRLLWFTISHEMRHLWQMRNGESSFSGYKSSDAMDTEDYNRQEEELDAHAWAVAVMITLFGIRPTLEEQLGAEVWGEIEKRALILTEDMRRMLT